jgi:hypothetical protein
MFYYSLGADALDDGRPFASPAKRSANWRGNSPHDRKTHHGDTEGRL